jgi:tRNA nucleotidyltransferase (CCA-adding enzyme)
MVLTLPQALEQIVRDLRASGFLAVAVGGSVRDALLGLTPKDFDIEVYGMSYDHLADFLAHRGRVDLVGKSFGVVKFTGSGPDESNTCDTCDFSIPRRDSKTGPSHRDFRADFDESITPREAASRRDFTINAMSFDPIAGEVWDFFGGQVDLNNRILRATSDAFSEDPLRVLRGMQFACRFDLTVDPLTASMSRSIAPEYATLARERTAEEFMKWAVKSAHPGRIGEYLQATGWIGHFPEIENLFGVPQDPEWHPEGDVGIHTMHVLNQAARIAERDHLAADDRAVLLFASLAHDFAKPATTELREREGRVRWTSWGHEPAGGPLARAFLERIGIKSAIVDQVVPLVENHLSHHSIGPDVTPRAVRRLAMRVAPASIGQLVRLIEADASGRPPLAPGVPPAAARILAAAESEAVESRPQPPLILGRHVLPYFDDRPGVHIGEVTHAAYEAQADGAFSSQEEALRWLDEYMAHRPPVTGR